MTFVRHLKSALAIAMLAACGVVVAAAPLDASLKAAMEGSTVPAMGVTLIRDGKVVASAVNGMRASDRADPAQIGDAWHLGSNGKAMTATMIARLVERGVLSWDAPLSTLLPDLAATMQPGYRAATLRDLLTHQAGLHENINEDAVPAFYTDKRPMHEQRLAYATLALAQAPAYLRGTADAYSNNGLLIAGLIAERATGLSYEQLMRREVFEPLGMHSAAFGPTRRGQPLGHHLGKPKEGVEADNPAVLAPAGEINMSLQDWSLFAIDQMQGKGKLLKAPGYAILHAAARDGGKYGMGWRRQDTMQEVAGPFLSHSGSNEYWFAVIALRPGTQDGVLVVSNAGPDAKAHEAVSKVVKLLVKDFARPYYP